MTDPDVSSRTAALNCLRSIDPVVPAHEAIAAAHVQALIYIGDVLAAAAGVGAPEERPSA